MLNKDVVIIGGGPAGLSAGIYGVRAGLDTLVLERSAMNGGQIRTAFEVENYPGLGLMSGFALGGKMEDHAKALSVPIRQENVTHINIEERGFTIETNRDVYYAQSVILAMGTGYAHLGIPGEGKLTGMGVSYCATCDGAFFRGKEVAVIGGGDVAVGDAIFLASFCKKVTLIHRRNQLRAAKSLQEKLIALPNVEILWDTVCTEIMGEDVVEGVCIQRKGNEATILPVQGVFVAIGLKPNKELVENLFRERPEMADKTGFIRGDESCRSVYPGLYVAGDLRTKALRQVVTAVSDGANAIQSIIEDRNS